MFIIIFILALMLLVLSHEMGHFLMAKRFGIKVLEFGFGIPPKLLSKKFGETKYSLNLLLIGGFVRLLGEDEVDSKLLKDSRSFAYQSASKRFAVVAAGVVMNLLLAWALFYVVLISSNFRIIFPTSKAVAVVAGVQSGSVAEKAGLAVGDRVLAVNGEAISSVEEAISKIKPHPNQEVRLKVGDLEAGNIHEVVVIPQEVRPNEGLIGVAFSPIPLKEYHTFWEKLFSGITYSAGLTKSTLAGLGKLVFDIGKGNLREASQSVAGPVGLAKVSQSIYSLGPEAVIPYVWFIAVISLTLAIFNVLPIPALDGGRLAFILYEIVTRRKPNPEFERVVHNVGMAILLILIALITFSDIKKLF